MTKWLRAGRWTGIWLMSLLIGLSSRGQGVTTTTVQGTVYEASGSPAAGTLLVSWPSFTTAAGQTVTAGTTTATIGLDGFVSLNLAPNLGATPAGLYYTVVYQLSDGTVNTEYWVVPATTTATIASVEAQVMPAAQAVQAVTEAYVNQQIAALGTSQLSPSGGTLTGPLTLSGDPTSPLMAADKHYVDESFAQAVPLAGGTMTGGLGVPAVNGVASPVSGTAQTNLQATVTAAGTNGGMIVPPTYAGTDTFSNPNGIRVEDWRMGVAQQHARNVKEFGAVCDGATDDTAALQAAINYANQHHVGLTLPSGICKTHKLTWHLESIGGQGEQDSALMGFPGEDVLATAADSPTLEIGTRLHDLTIYVDQSVDVSCSAAEGRAAAGSCGVNRPLEAGSVFSPGGNGLTGTAGSGAGWMVGNCAIAMPAVTGAGGNGLRSAVIENVAIATTGSDPLGGYAQASSTHTCGMYLAQWPVGTEFRNVSITGVGTGVAVPALAGTVPAGLTADHNRWTNLTVAAVHGLVAEAGANDVLDGVAVNAWNSAATGEAPTGLVLNFAGVEEGWTVRNSQVAPEWVAVQPQLGVSTTLGAVTGVTVGPEHGLGFEAYGVTVPLSFSGSCTAQATAAVNGDGSLGAVTVSSGGFGCSGTTTATVNVAGTWMSAKPVNLISGQKMTVIGGNLLAGHGGYTVWNASSSEAMGTAEGGGGTLTASTTVYPALVIAASATANGVSDGYTGSSNRIEQPGLTSAAELTDTGLGNVVEQTSGYADRSVETARLAEGKATGDFALLGGGAANQAFTSLNDLFLTTEDLLSASGESVGMGSQSGKDATAPVTGSYVRAVGGAWDTTGNWSVRGATGSLLLGSGFPAGTGTWVVAAKSDTAATQELKLMGAAGGQSCVFADQTVSLTPGWQVFRIPYNTVTGNSTCDAGTAGNAVSAQGLTPSTLTNVETAWMSFVPAFQQLLVANAPTAPEQAANKAYVDQAVASQIASGSGELPISGGTMTGALNAPVVNGTTNCALSGSVSGCVASASSALIPPGTTGSFAQNAVMTATAQCVYDPTQGGVVTGVLPGQLGQGYRVAPMVTVSGGGGSGLQVSANLSGGEVTSYTVNNAGSGYTSCPSITVAAPPAAVSPVPVLDQRRGVTTYSADIRVDDFGCAGDGVTDDTQCFNNAIAFVTQNGTRAGSISLTQGKTYFIGTITGYMQTAWDDGTAPSTDTCGGVACTNIAPETPGYLGYAIRVPSGQTTPLTIFGNGASIVSSFTGTAVSAPAYTMAAPYFAVFGSDQGYASWNVFDLNVSNAFIFAATKSGAYWRWERVNMNGVGMAMLAGSSQYDQFRDLNLQDMMSGLIIGGWWGTRAPNTSASGNTYLNDENLGDQTFVDGITFYGMNWQTQAQSQTAQNALDSWFNTYFFHVSDNQTRLTDQNQAPVGGVTDSLWRGVYHVMLATYSRYYRPVYGVYLHNANVKSTQNYPVVGNGAVNWRIDTLNTENVGWCDANSLYGAYGSTSCPNPYDSVNNELMGAVLLYNFQNITANNIDAEGSPIAETIAEPPQVSAAQELSDFRFNLTNLQGQSVSTIIPRTAPVPTGRLLMAPSTGTALAGQTSENSGELCFEGLINGYGDMWCLRAEEQAYSGGFAAPRYLVLESESTSPFSGTTAVQLPGLRVRPGTISAADGTLPVTDFAEQSFAISGGTVKPESCATVPGITLENAATSDGVLFVAPPSSAGGLQMSGAVTGANTLALTLCNTTTSSANYPTGTYYAFLLAGAPTSSVPAVSGGVVTNTNPLTASQGDLVVGDVNGNPTRLPGNSSTTPAMLVDVGNGTGALEPMWVSAPTFAGGNLTGLNASNITTGTLSVGNGGTGSATASGALASLGGASLTAPLTAFSGKLTGRQVGGLVEVDQETGANFGVQLAACVAGLNATNGGICDARNYGGTQTVSTTLTIGVSNTAVYLPCATIAMTAPIVIPAGVRNVRLHGCALRGGTLASGTEGGTVLAYSGSGAALQVGDVTYATDTLGFAMDNVLVNTTGTTSAGTEAFAAFRVQELHLESDYYLGNSNQIAMQLDGTGNYTGGTFEDQAFNGFAIAVNGVGHQIANPATTDWVNASTFVRVHIDCPTASGSPIAGTVGINLLQGDGNTFTGGDVESCSTAVHLGPNAQNNTLVGVRNENSTTQVIADAGSQFNSWMTGGTMFTGALVDNGSRNSFLDAFHRTFNGVNGDWYASQKDATVTNHYRLGTGTGNVRGLEWESQVDVGTTSSQYNWLWGLTDGGSGESNWIFQDLLNGTIRLQMEEHNAAGNNATAINGTGTGNVCFQCSGNAGTGGVAFSSGGATPTTVATVDGSGNANFLGALAVAGASTFAGSTTVKNAANAEIDATLWAGATASQKESFLYKDYSGASQWYMVKDGSNNWALNSAIDGVDHVKAYQNGDDYLDAAGTGAVRFNLEANAGTGGVAFYSGGATPTEVAKIDGGGNLTVASCTGCGATSGGAGTVNSGTAGQLAYYATTGPAVSGLATTGSGNAVLATSPTVATPTVSGTATFTGSVALTNASNAAQTLSIQPGTTADQNGVVAWNNYLGTNEWTWKKDSGNTLRMTDAANGLDRMIAYQNGQTAINSGAGANAVVVNNTSGSGTGGFIVYEGGANANTPAMTVTGAGNLNLPGTATVGSLTITYGPMELNQAANYVSVNDNYATATACEVGGGLDSWGWYWNGSSAQADHIKLTASCVPGTNGAETMTFQNSGSSGPFTVAVNGADAAEMYAGSGGMGLATGAAAGTGATIGCASGHTCDGVSGALTLTTGTSPTTGTLATLTFPYAHTARANCVVSVSASGVGAVNAVEWSETTTAVTLTGDAALSATTGYTVKYWCGGQ